jgi:hypothetical protein
LCQTSIFHEIHSKGVIQTNVKITGPHCSAAQVITTFRKQVSKNMARFLPTYTESSLLSGFTLEGLEGLPQHPGRFTAWEIVQLQVGHSPPWGLNDQTYDLGLAIYIHRR